MENKSVQKEQKIITKDIEIKELLKRGFHFGHKVSKSHPKMSSFILTRKGDIYIIDVSKSIEFIKNTMEYVKNLGKENKIILFVCTKKHIREIIKTRALEINMPYIIEKWIPGLLTNWNTLRSQIKKVRKLKEEFEKGEWIKYTKKERLEKEEELKKKLLYYEGVLQLEKLPDALYIIDFREEKIAWNECLKLGIKTIGICDTDINISKIDFPIPGNDDSVKSVEYISDLIVASYKEGMQYKELNE